MPHSVTRLLGLGLTPGKLRGLQRISNPNGTLTMVATDQNSSMISMMKEATEQGADLRRDRRRQGDARRGRSSPHCSGPARGRLLRVLEHRRRVRRPAEHRAC